MPRLLLQGKIVSSKPTPIQLGDIFIHIWATVEVIKMWESGVRVKIYTSRSQWWDEKDYMDVQWCWLEEAQYIPKLKYELLKGFDVGKHRCIK